MRLGYARLRFSQAYDSECTIVRNGVAVAANVPCMVEVTSDQNQNVDGQTVPIGAFLVSMPVNYTVLYGDYIQEKGRQLRVIRQMSPKSYEVATQVYAMDVGPIPEDIP